MLSYLHGRFDFVIVDSPPINAVTDPLLLAATADATLLVVEHGRTTYPALRNAKQALDRVGARTIGVVMNKQRSSDEFSYYDYRGAPERPGSQAGKSGSRRSTGQHLGQTGTTRMRS